MLERVQHPEDNNQHPPVENAGSLVSASAKPVKQLNPAEIIKTLGMHHENICKKYDFMYDRNEYRIKYVYVQTSRKLKQIMKKMKGSISRVPLLSDKQREYFVHVAHINTYANFVQKYIFLRVVFTKV